MATLRAIAYHPPGHGRATWDLAVLGHDERLVRQGTIPLVHGDEVTVDFPTFVRMEQRGALELDDGRHVEIISGEEYLYEVRGRDAKHLMQLCWHLGRRRAKA